MAHKKQHTGPVPPGNQSQAGPAHAASQASADEQEAGGGAPAQEQDEQRRLGNFESAGEHSLQQPGGKNDANH